MIRIKDLPQKVVCPKCGSPNVGLLDIEEEKASVLTEKRGERLTKGESTLKEKEEKTARLIRVYGKPAALALCVKRIRLKDAEEVLKQEKELSDKFFELLMDAERKALSRRFW
jgi:uncharacterized Zn finger protein (UPF0148 family)